MQGHCPQGPLKQAIGRQATQQTGTAEMHQTGAQHEEIGACVRVRNYFFNPMGVPYVRL